MVNELKVTGFDAIELYVGNARQAALYYQRCFGFDIVGFRGPETGSRNVATYLLVQHDIKLLLTTALNTMHPASDFVRQHGDGVRSIHFACTNVTEAYHEATLRGAKSLLEPKKIEDEWGYIEIASIQTYGNVIHSLVDRSQYSGFFEPGFTDAKGLSAISGMSQHTVIKPIGLQRIDHIVGNVPTGQMNYWANYYQQVFGFDILIEFSEEDIRTDNSSLASKVMKNKSLSIKLPINEPGDGPRKSQIQEYLDFNNGAGVQHIALYTDNIVETIQQLRANEVSFITVPASYYQLQQERYPHLKIDWVSLQKLGILIDKEQDGYLLQLFTQPVQDRPTLFFEIVQRVDGAIGFGHGNFKALFESIEREQAARGNL